MGFRVKIFAVLAGVGLLPAALLGWLSFSVNRAELEHSAGASQSAIAQEVARSSERFVLQAVESLRLSTSVLPLDALSDDELGTVLRIPYRQLDFLDALWVLGPDGRPLTRVVYESGNQRPEPLPELLLRGAPLALALQAGTALGQPYSTNPVRLPLALKLSATKLLAAEVSLAPLQKQLQQLSQNGTEAFVATQSGTLLAQGAPGALSADELALVKQGAGVNLVKRAGGVEWLAAAAPAGALGWTVVVAQPASLALHPAAVVRGYTIFWLGIAALLVVVLGLLLSRRVTEPIERLQASVKALLEGRAQQAEVESEDEIGQFARAFNSMAGEIVRRDDEIRRWNAELQARVDQRTAELKAAQDQILRARRLAALGSLGAGVAHEVNNPLTAISGLASLLELELAGTKHAEPLRTLRQQVARVSKIIGGLRALTDQERAQAGRRFGVQEPVRAALNLFGEQLREKKITLHTELHDCEAQGDPAQIQQAVQNLVENAIHAMPQGGELRIQLGGLDGDAVKLTVTDTGKGIPAALKERIFDPFFTTKDEPGGVGLGLPVSHQIIEAHHGRLMVDSTEGHGATFTIVLPAAAAAAHLR